MANRAAGVSEYSFSTIYNDIGNVAGLLIYILVLISD